MFPTSASRRGQCRASCAMQLVLIGASSNGPTQEQGTRCHAFFQCIPQGADAEKARCCLNFFWKKGGEGWARQLAVATPEGVDVV